ncbi:MAG TPA: hypothetical protein VN682_21060 [Terriglobales bacterium]|nr:hypothetical protein [Terriglobales bacterium]
MGIFNQIGARTEFLAPDFVWLGILTPPFFSVIGVAEAEGLIALSGSIHAFELSVLLSYLASAAIKLPNTRSAALSSEPARCRRCGSHVSQEQVQDATE